MHVAFSIWYLWSVMVLFMPQSVYGFSPSDKLLLSATAALVGAVVRIPYTMAAARFGGRNWAIFSSLVLLIPSLRRHLEAFCTPARSRCCPTILTNWTPRSSPVGGSSVWAAALVSRNPHGPRRIGHGQ